MAFETGETRRDKHVVKVVSKSPFFPWEEIQMPIFHDDKCRNLQAEALREIGPLTFVKKKVGGNVYYFLAWKKDHEIVIHGDYAFVFSLTPISGYRGNKDKEETDETSK